MHFALLFFAIVALLFVVPRASRTGIPFVNLWDVAGTLMFSTALAFLLWLLTDMPFREVLIFFAVFVVALCFANSQPQYGPSSLGAWAGFLTVFGVLAFFFPELLGLAFGIGRTSIIAYASYRLFFGGESGFFR
jgi:hypothetical protein